MYIVVFMGPPGIGKGTLAKICETQLNWFHVSTGALCREYSQRDNDLGKKIAHRINQGLLIEDDLMLQMLQDRLFEIDKKEGTIIFDGFPRNIEQIKLLFKTFFDSKIVFVFFNASNSVIINRLKNRLICSNPLCDAIYNSLTYTSSNCKLCNSILVKRKDDSEDVISKRLDIYNNLFPQVYLYIKNNNYKYIDINAELSKPQIYEEFIFKINSKNNNDN